jgi:cation/acetate symporter
VQQDLGFSSYSAPFTDRGQLDMFLATATLMCGTAGLPHVIVRFYTAKSVRAARWSAFWALAFIAILYTTAPAVAVFAKFNLIDDVSQRPVADMPAWVDNWEQTGLITIDDIDDNGVVDYTPDEATNELTIDPDIMVLANPEVAGLPSPVVGLVAAGGLAAALSTASGLLLVISSSVAHDLYYKRLRPEATEAERLRVGRIAMAGAVVVAGYFGVNPPGFVAEVVALAFGLAAASFFPVIVLGIFWRRANAQGAIAGLLVGLSTASLYMYFVLFQDMQPWFDISAIGIGAVSMVLNAVTMVVVSRLTPPPPAEMQALIEHIRHPWVDVDEARTEVEDDKAVDADSS